MRRTWKNILLIRSEAEQLMTFCKQNGIKFSTGADGDYTYMSLFVTEAESKSIQEWIDENL